jgi:hypothetical protein
MLHQAELVDKDTNMIYIEGTNDEEQLKYLIKSNLLYIRKLMMIDTKHDNQGAHSLEKKLTAIFN